MTENSIETIARELTELRKRVAELEAETAETETMTLNRAWTQRFYWTYYATAGFFLGMIAALASLALNVVGSYAINQHPLQLIKVYLTFGLGEKALAPELSDGLVLVIGCCLYIATGMLLGIPFQVLMSRYCANGGLTKRLMFTSIVALGIWLFNFYAILSWLQQLLFGGTWIVDPMYLPPWVAAATHLVFGWTMALLYPLGKFEPYHARNSEI